MPCCANGDRLSRPPFPIVVPAPRRDSALRRPRVAAKRRAPGRPGRPERAAPGTGPAGAVHASGRRNRARRRACAAVCAVDCPAPPPPGPTAGATAAGGAPHALRGAGTISVRPGYRTRCHGPAGPPGPAAGEKAAAGEQAGEARGRAEGGGSFLLETSPPPGPREGGWLAQGGWRLRASCGGLGPQRSSAASSHRRLPKTRPSHVCRPPDTRSSHH